MMPTTTTARSRAPSAGQSGQGSGVLVVAVPQEMEIQVLLPQTTQVFVARLLLHDRRQTGQRGEPVFRMGKVEMRKVHHGTGPFRLEERRQRLA
jgi:hypothetical protein